MLKEKERAEIARLWARKVDQDARKLPQSERHRNLEPVSAEFISSLAAGIGAKRLLEIGGSSGISTIALAAAARETGGRLVSIEIEPKRQAEARETIQRLGLADYVEFVLADAALVLPGYAEPFDFALIDCEKNDYVRFFDMIPAGPGRWLLPTTFFRTASPITWHMYARTAARNPSRSPSARGWKSAFTPDKNRRCSCAVA